MISVAVRILFIPTIASIGNVAVIQKQSISVPVDTAYHGEMAVKLVTILRKTARNRQNLLYQLSGVPSGRLLTFSFSAPHFMIYHPAAAG
jgi:hypothetical protein